jgi:hypothetical protein
MSDYPSHDDWISLMDPAETREHPSDVLVEVKGNLSDDEVTKTYFSRLMGDWMCHGDPTHWRPIKDSVN